MKDFADSYNVETDGKIKYINGSLVFVPYMKGINDPIYKEFIEELLQFDWLHYKLYLVGGILEGWPTTDIDICITGKRKPELINLLNKSREIGPFDMYWVKSLKGIEGNGTRVWKFAKSHDRYSNYGLPWIGKWKKDGLYHMTHKFKIKENRKYIQKPLLIN